MQFRISTAVVTNTVVLIAQVAVLQVPVTVDGYNILAIFPFSGKSHFYMFRAVLEALVDRGHDVTVVSHFPVTKQEQRPQNRKRGIYTDYSLVDTVPIFENLTTNEVTGNGFLEEFLFIMQDGLDNCEGIMSSGRINELMRSKVKFDLVIVEVSDIVIKKIVTTLPHYITIHLQS